MRNRLIVNCVYGDLVWAHLAFRGMLYSEVSIHDLAFVHAEPDAYTGNRVIVLSWCLLKYEASLSMLFAASLSLQSASNNAKYSISDAKLQCIS